MPVTNINLTVRSRNNGVYTTTTTTNFVVDKMGEIVANQNTDTTNSVTEAGDSANQLSLWELYGSNGQLLYWKLTNPSGTLHDISLYKGQNGANIVAWGQLDGDGVVEFNPMNQSGISGAVTLVFSAEDTDNANTVQCTTDITEKDLELPGNTQFTYEEQNGEIAKYTVDETVAAITTSINGSSEYLEATLNLTTAQITVLNGTPKQIIATPGAGYVIEIISGIVIYTYGVAQYTVRLDVDLVSGTTGTQLWTAVNAVSGTANKITRFTNVAGIIQSNQSIKCKMNTGDPTVGAGCTGTAKVIVTYKITAL